MNNFINTAASDIARARTVGLNQLTPDPFPILVVGTNSPQSFFFASRGTLETWSGDSSYRLRLTVGNVTSQSVAGTYSIAVSGGATLTIPYDLDAAGLQNVLNDDSTIGTTDGGVYVFDRGYGRFLIAYKATGTPTALSASAALLVPDCAAELSVITPGGVSTRQLMLLTLRRSVPAQTSAFSIISSPYAGWSGTLDLTSSATYQLLWLNGVRAGPYLELTTLLTLEVIDGSGNANAYYQTPVLLRGLNYMDTTTLGVGPSRHAQTSSAAGTVTVAPSSQLHTEILTFTGSANTRNVVVSTTGLIAGAQVDLSCIVSGVTDGAVINIYQNSTSDTKLVQFTKATADTNMMFCLRANGAGGFSNVEQVVPAYVDAS